MWTNQDTDAHTVSSATGAWTESGTLATSTSFSHTFTTRGTYQCAFHPFMTAKVVVS